MRPGNGTRTLAKPTRAKFSRATSNQGGFTLLVVVAFVALLAVGMYRVATVLVTQKQRDQEQLLLRVGQLYAAALQHYRQAAPGSAKPYPSELKQLLLDTRFVGVARHMREAYPDPMQPDLPWGLVRDASGGIVGVYSTSLLRPLLQTADAPSANAQHYSDWKFLAKDTP